MKVNETQFAAVERIIQKYAIAYGSSGTDQHRRRAATAVMAVLLGKIDSTPDEYRQCVNGVELPRNTSADTSIETVDPSIAANAKKAGLFDDITFGRDEKNRPELLLGEHIAAVFEFHPGIYKASATVEELVTEAAAVGEPIDGNEELTDDDEELPEQLVEGETAPSFKPELEARTVVQLKSIASDCDVTIPSDATKAMIIDLILDKATTPMIEAALEAHPVA